MKTIFGILVATQVAVGASVYKTVVIPQRLSAKSVDVNLMSPSRPYDGATLVLKGMGRRIQDLSVEVNENESHLAECEVTVRRSDRDAIAYVSFDAELDDGMNVCSVDVRRPNDQKFTVRLFVNVDF